MIIDRITIQNFKGVKKPVTLDLKPITLLFGKNSTGKSSIIQALNYMRQIFVTGELEPDKNKAKNADVVDLGGYENIVNDHDLEKPIIFDFHMSEPNIRYYYNGLPGYPSWDDILSVSSSRWNETDDEEMNKRLKELRSLLPNMFKNTKRMIEDPSFQPENALDDIAREIQQLDVKLILQWNAKLKKPYIELYQVKTNNELLFQIYRHKDNNEMVQLYSYENPILPQHLINIINRANTSSQTSKNNSGKEKEIDRQLAEGTQKYASENFVFREILEQKKALPDIEGSMSIVSHYSNKLENIDTYFSWLEEIEGKKEVMENDFFIGIHHFSGKFFEKLLSMLVTMPIHILQLFFTNGFNHIGPLRELPLRNHVPLYPKIFSRWVSGLAAYDILLDKETPQEMISETNKWLSSDHFDTGYRIDIKKNKTLDTDSKLFKHLVSEEDSIGNCQEIKEWIENLPEKRSLHVMDVFRKLPLSLRDIGTGISQILPIIVGSLYLKDALFCIEQPELHIHPAMQAEMVDLFINQIYEKEKRTHSSFVIETHSEYLMLRLLRRIRNTKENEGNIENPIYSDDVAVYYLVKDENVTDAIHIPITEEGEFLLPWPNGFFPERAKELFS